MVNHSLLAVMLLGCMMSLTSCLNDWLTLEPLADITNENFWKSESDARSELNSGYAFIRKAYQTGFLNWTEIRSDNFLGNITGGQPVQNVSLNRLSSNLSSCSWNDWYNLVSVANYAIHFLPNIQSNADAANYNHMTAEAHFLRAYAYFYLYRVWGDVPLVTEPVLTKSMVTKPRVTGKDTIFSLVVRDLAIADSLVDVTKDNTIFRFSAGALYALTVDVAMWQKDYQKAVDFADKLYALNKYSIEGVDFAKVCQDATTTDNIWTLDWNFTTDGDNSITVSLANSSNPEIPTFEMYQKWFAWEREFDNIDARRAATIDSAKYKTFNTKHVNSLPAGAQCWKWSPGEHLAQTEYRNCKMPLYRLADIILLRAEALNKLGRMDEAIEEMNRVRVRAHLTPKAADYYNGDVAKLDEDIFQERQFELYAEGRRWFDLMRTGRVEKVMNAYFDGYIKKYGGKDYHLFEEEWQRYWPIYQDILNENENLHQIGNY